MCISGHISDETIGAQQNRGAPMCLIRLGDYSPGKVNTVSVPPSAV
jgi:hypothetical protein